MGMGMRKNEDREQSRNVVEIHDFVPGQVQFPQQREGREGVQRRYAVVAKVQDLHSITAHDNVTAHYSIDVMD